MMGRLDRDWAGRTVFCVGGGPSLKDFDFDRIRGRGIVVAINDGARRLPWADVVFSIDTVWMRQREAFLREWPQEAVLAVPFNYARFLPRVRYIHRTPGGGINHDPTRLCVGGNSGFGALGMAVARGASRIGLLGYDMNSPGQHWHRGYEWAPRTGSAADMAGWAYLFGSIARVTRRTRQRVINCNPASAIRCFPFGQPEDIAE